jgi:hypothetical protein
MRTIGKYINGNYQVSIYDDGTKIRFCKDDSFAPAFAENIDVKITNRCGGGCPFCHEGSTAYGAHGDIMNMTWVDSLHPYQELAIGGGNVFEHPDLIPFLEKLKEMKVIANITVRAEHFWKNTHLLGKMIADGLVHGVGVSVSHPTVDELRQYAEVPNVVLHVINGIFDEKDLAAMMEAPGNRLLILGYKTVGRGNAFLRSEEKNVAKRQRFLKDHIKEMLEGGDFRTISFDNLAIEQLGIRDLLTEDQWETQYMGDEGTTTFYIDCVAGRFAESSVAPEGERFPIMGSVDGMFDAVRRNKAERK